MRHFIDIVAAADEATPEYEMFLRVLFSRLKNGLRSKNEMVRMEVLGVIAYSVEQCQRKCVIYLKVEMKKLKFSSISRSIDVQERCVD